MEHIKSITLGTGRYISSYDVTALFMSVPLEMAIEIIKHRLTRQSLTKNNNVSTTHYANTMVLSTQHISCFMDSSVSRWMGQPWGLQSVPLFDNLCTEAFDSRAL